MSRKQLKQAPLHKRACDIETHYYHVSLISRIIPAPCGRTRPRNQSPLILLPSPFSYRIGIWEATESQGKLEVLVDPRQVAKPL